MWGTSPVGFRMIVSRQTGSSEIMQAQPFAAFATIVELGGPSGRAGRGGSGGDHVPAVDGAAHEDEGLAGDELGAADVDVVEGDTDGTHVVLPSG